MDWYFCVLIHNNCFQSFVCYVGKLLWEGIVADILKEFGDVLDIEKKPITLDGRLPDSKEMKSLRKQVKVAAEKIKVGRWHWIPVLIVFTVVFKKTDFFQTFIGIYNVILYNSLEIVHGFIFYF